MTKRRKRESLEEQRERLKRKVADRLRVTQESIQALLPMTQERMVQGMAKAQEKFQRKLLTALEDLLDEEE